MLVTLPRSISSALTLLPTNLHPFHLDTEDITYIHRCILGTIKKCEVEKILEWCIATNLVSCLFDDPMHPKDYPMSRCEVVLKCNHHCRYHFGLHFAPFMVECYEEQMERH
jgi:hypothetical protein